MDRSNCSNEVLLDFSCLFWDFITQWKAIIIFSLIISLLFTCIKYKRDSVAYEAAVSAANENNLTSEQLNQRIQDTLDALSPEDKAAVNYALGFYSLISDKQAYQRESPLMNVDPNHVDMISLGFKISGDLDQSLISSIDNGYLTVFNDTSALEDISNATTSEIEPDYIKEMIYYSDPSKDLSTSPDSIIEDNSFNIYVIIPPDEDSELIKNAVINTIKNKCNDLSKSVAPHSVSVISNTSSTTACSSIMSRQSDVYYSLAYMKSSLSSVLAELGNQQIAAYNTVLHLQSIATAKDDAQTEADTTVPVKPGISKRALLVGFGLGIIFYLFIFIIYTLLRDKVASSIIAKKLLHQRLIGECYSKKPDITVFQKLFHSTCVFNYRYRGKTDNREQVDSITQTLGAISAKEHISNISIINTSSDQDNLADSIIAKGKENSLSIGIIKDEDILKDSSLIDITDAVISVSNNTCVKQLNSLIDLLDYYRINVLGFIFSADH